MPSLSEESMPTRAVAGTGQAEGMAAATVSSFPESASEQMPEPPPLHSSLPGVFIF